MTPQLADATARTQIRDQLASTLFVDAGAGSGKTASLVGRVVGLVLTGGLALRNVAAVTFTEKAAAELRDRLREEFENARTDAAQQGDDARVAAADAALDDLDGAAIGTLHSFAQRILGEHPIEAGLPPLIEVSDEVRSQITFEDRWATVRRSLLDEPDMHEALVLALVSGIRLDHLRAIALKFNAEWDRLDAAVLAHGMPPVPSVDVARLVESTRETRNLARHCSDGGDRLLANLVAFTKWVDRLQQAADAPAQLGVLAEAEGLRFSHGKKANWACDLDDVRQGIKDAQAGAAALQQRVIDRVLRRLAFRIAEATIAAARERQREGRLEFHDLLVLAREVLRSPGHGAAVREALAIRYQRLLLDEFQDTDPIQIELALRISGGAAANGNDWRELAPPDGRLFVVGDPKQSIYRFRRADIATYLEAQSRIGTRVALTTNFRTTPPLIRWVNHVFDRLIVEMPDSQPAYLPLDTHREDAPGGARVIALGADAHSSELKADDVREEEALDVAAIIQSAISEEWCVYDVRKQEWRAVALDDIAILVPARTSLPILEETLDAAGIPYRAEASSLVYRTPEVRDLLMVARAADDPSDVLATVASLRSPLFGCGDDDLWTWKDARCSFSILAPFPDDMPASHPVRDALAYLRQLHDDARLVAPSALLDRVVRDRRMLEVVAGEPRARDVWRRLRFVVDQARAWTDAGGGSLRDYLAWARRQGEESARVAEAVLPETDAKSVRIMTIHSAKGLEFPVVILSGLSSRPGGGRGSAEVLWPRAGGYEVKLGKSAKTGDFDTHKPIDEEMSHHERLRLLYVGCTRARDHLVVSLHRAERKKAPEGDDAKTSAELLAEASTGAPAIAPFIRAESPAAHVDASVQVTKPVSYDEWSARVLGARAAAARTSAVSASSLEGATLRSSGGEGADAKQVTAGLDKGPRNLELPPWNKGRYGTAVGRAVHGALQTTRLSDGHGLAEAVHAQALAEGVLDFEPVVKQLCEAALASPVITHAATRRHWRESYVGTTVVNGVILEGYLDLVYEDHDGSLVIVDYKTDAVPSAALRRRTSFYRPQMAAYAHALHRATGRDVTRAVLLFLAPTGATAAEIAGGDLAVDLRYLIDQ